MGDIHAMGIFKFGKKALEVGDNIVGKVVGNSKNANQLDARNKEMADGTSFLDKIIHELVILIVIATLITSNYIDVPKETIDMFRQAFWVMIGFLYGRTKKK